MIFINNLGDTLMQKILHPITKQLITYKEYKKFATLQGYQILKNAPKTTCPVCHGEMIPRAGQTKDNGHFAHEEDQSCPTKTPAARPYLGLHNYTVKPIVVKYNKDFAKDNIEAIYTRISEIAPYLDLKEFIKILEEAKRLNIYKYTDLVPEYLPYVYVTLINFLPSKSLNKKRLYKFMFFYESHIQNLNDLWIHNGIDSRLYRISYEKSIAKKVTEIDITDNYLTSPVKKLSLKQKEWCNKAI